MEDRPLPEDVVATVLRRLPPRDLAVSRRVCKAWRAVVDESRTLRPDLLPLALGGIFISLLREPAPPVLFSPPSMGPHKIAGKLQSFVKMDGGWDLPTIIGSCNGLLFLNDQVANPATRQWAPVPLCPVGWDVYNHKGEVYFVFDPFVSPHYQVLFVQDPYDLLEEESEWPASTYAMWIYSSGTGRWEEKPFVREGGPAGTVAEERSARVHDYLHSVYWREALYVHCNNDFIMLITISDLKYEVIKLPAGVSSSVDLDLHLVKSKNGVYFASVVGQCQLRVWFLNELCEWVLKYDINLQAVPAHFSRDHDRPVDKPWILHYGKYNNREATAEGVSDWDSDNDNVIQIDDTEGKCDLSQFICIFGFHPYKEVAILYLPNNDRVVACHLDSLKIQDLGQLRWGFRSLIESTKPDLLGSETWNEMM
ncbi:hypothetical protein EJB05_40741, partial [Eragrostis curvula]